MTDPITLTRDELVDVFHLWETRRRLRPEEFASFELVENVEKVAERSAESFERYLAEIRPAAMVWQGPVAGDSVGPVDGSPITLEVAARKAAAALDAGDVDSAAGWTNLARVLS